MSLYPSTNVTAAYREPLVYNFQVAREVLKRIYIAERLQPPSLSTFQSTYSALWARASNPTYWTRDFFRNGDIYKVGIYGLEAYGIFKVSRYTSERRHGVLFVKKSRLTRVAQIGEIIGRRSLVGYNIQ